MKNKRLSIYILIVAMALVLYFTLKDDFGNIIEKLANVDKKFFILAIIVFLISLLLKALSLKTFLNEYNKEYTLKKAFKLTLISQFLNGITPFQTGGQPFQIYLLKKDGIRISDSANAMLKDFISFQIALILMGIFAILSSIVFKISTIKGTLGVLIFLGFLINLAVLLFLILVIYAKGVIIKIIDVILGFIYRFNFMSKISITKERIMDGVNNFYETGKELRKNKLKLFIGVFCNLASFITLYLIPFIIFKSLDVNISILESIVSVAFVMLIGNFIPIPGATGGIEYGFLKFFEIYAKNPLLSSAMLLWRFVTYIFGMIIGFVVLIVNNNILNSVFKNTKNKENKQEV